MKKTVINLVFIFLVSCEALFIGDISNDKVVVLVPQNNTEKSAGDITFAWNEMTDADEYRITIVSPSFENATELIVNTTTTTTSITQNLTAGEYEWSIIGLNAEYESAENVFSLTVN